MRYVWGAIYAGLLATVMTLPAAAQMYTDTDWSEPFKTSCGFPRADNAQWVERKGDQYIRFNLREGDVGNCPTDQRKSGKFQTRERAELAQKTKWMRLGESYDIRFETIFEQGFNGRGEIFFQIHGFNQGCNAAPLLMMLFADQKLTIRALTDVGSAKAPKGRYAQVATFRPRIQSLYNQPVRFDISADLAERGTARILMNGKPITDTFALGAAACATPYVKFGIYRTGESVDPAQKNPRGLSVALFDDVQINER
jgi:hypothetical protein